MTTRTATVERRTGETEVRLTLTLDGEGRGTRKTGVGFFDHMLDLLARHGHMDLDVSVSSVSAFAPRLSAAAAAANYAAADP